MLSSSGAASANLAALAALQRVIAAACLGEESGAGGAPGGDLAALLAAHGVDDDDAAAIMVAPRRLGVYRSLVRNGLASVITRMLPETRARLNATCDDRFDRDFRAFLAQVGPRTHYLRDVPAEFTAWAAPRWRADPVVPAYVVELAAYELASFAVAARELRADGAAREATEILIDKAVAFDDAMVLARYAWAVHALPPFDAADPSTHEPPAERAVCLLAYRDANHVVRWLELTPLAATVIERLVCGEPLGPAIAGACADHATSPPAVALDVARLLADLGERGVLLGARPSSRG